MFSTSQLTGLTTQYPPPTYTLWFWLYHSYSLLSDPHSSFPFLQLFLSCTHINYKHVHTYIHAPPYGCQQCEPSRTRGSLSHVRINTRGTGPLPSHNFRLCELLLHLTPCHITTVHMTYSRRSLLLYCTVSVPDRKRTRRDLTLRLSSPPGRTLPLAPSSGSPRSASVTVSETWRLYGDHFSWRLLVPYLYLATSAL